MTQPRQNITIIRGAPGSGKSTLASLVLTNRVMYTAPHSKTLFAMGAESIMRDSGTTDRLVCWAEADMFMKDAEGNYHFDASKLRESHQKCLDAVTQALRLGHDVVVSNTFTKHWEYAPYLKAAEDVGATVQVIEVYGNFPSVHGVPADRVQWMRASFESHSMKQVY